MKNVLTHFLIISQFYSTQQHSRIQSRMMESYRHLLKPKRLSHLYFTFFWNSFTILLFDTHQNTIIMFYVIC